MSYVSQKDVPGGQPSTTTISTIAVQAGSSRVTVAVLQCGRLIHLQLAEAEPSLLKIGSSQEETRRYLQEHEQLLSNLKKHEDGVWVLLEEVDRNAGQAGEEGRVHEDMALTLSHAWRRLTAHLEKRRELLQISCDFFQQALEFAILIDKAEELLSCADRAKELLHKHSSIRRGLLLSSLVVLGKSEELLQFLHQLSRDNSLVRAAAAQDAQESCGKVERLMELLQDRRREVDQHMAQKCHLLEWEQEEEEVMRWFQSEAQEFMQQEQLGSSLSDSELLLREFNDFQLKAKDWSTRVEGLLLKAPEDVAQGSGRLRSLHGELCSRLATRHSQLLECNTFFKRVNKAFELLSGIEQELRNIKFQKGPLPELARRHQQLQRRVKEVAAEPTQQGQLLLQKLRPHSVQVEGLQRMLGYIQERVETLTRQCNGCQELSEKQQQLISCFQDLTDMVSNCVKCASSTLSYSTDLSPKLSEAEDVQNKHLELVAQTQDAEEQLKSTEGIISQLKVLEYSRVEEFVNMVSLLREELWLLSRNAMSRIEVLRHYVCFLRSAEEIQKQLQSLQETFQSWPRPEATEEESFAMKQVADDRWQALLEHFLTTQDLGNNFISSSKMMSKNLNMNLLVAVKVVEDTLENLSKKKTIMTDLWSSWQLRLSQMKSVKKEWKKFKDQIKKALHDLKTIEDRLVPVSRVDLGKDLITKLHENFSLTKNQFLQLNAEVEHMIKVSELLALKGITMKEKSEKVTELLQLHQRVKDRVTEYGHVQSMALKFHQLHHEIESLQASPPASVYQNVEQARAQLTQHQEKRRMVKQLYQLAMSVGTELNTSVEQLNALGFSAQEIQQKLEHLQTANARWSSEAECCEENLLISVHYCVFKEEIGELRESFKDLKKKFNNLKFNYMKKNEKARNTKAVKNQIQQIEVYIEKLQTLKKKMQSFTLKVSSNTHVMGNSLREMEDAVNELQQQLGDFERTIEEYRNNLEMNIRLQQVMEEYQFWCDEASATIIRVGKFSSECKTKESVSVLYKQFEKFAWPTVPQQEERISQITELAVRLHGREVGKKFVEKTVSRHTEIVESIKELCNGLIDLENRLQADESLNKTVKTQFDAKTHLDMYEEPEDDNAAHNKDCGEMSELKESGHTPENVRLGQEKEAAERKSSRQATMPEHTSHKLHRMLTETQFIMQEKMSHVSTVSRLEQIEQLQENFFGKTVDICGSPMEKDRNEGRIDDTLEKEQPGLDITVLSQGNLQDPAEDYVSQEGTDRQQELFTEESLSNDEYECTSPDDISLPPLSETPESILGPSENDLEDGFSLSSQGLQSRSLLPDGSNNSQQDRAESYVSSSGTVGTRFRAESSSFVHSPLTVPTPSLVSSTLSNILRSKSTDPPTSLSEFRQTMFSVHESYAQTKECVHEGIAVHVSPSLLTTELEAGLCQPRAVREEIRVSSQATQGPGFSRLLSNTTVTEGSPITLEVEVTGFPEPAVTWFKDGQKVSADKYVELSSKEGKHVLFIPAAAACHAGFYVAQAINCTGTMCSNGVVRVEGKPPCELDWLTCCGTFCILLWLMYLLLL